MFDRLKKRRLIVGAAAMLLALVLAAVGVPVEDVCNAAMEVSQ